ncbi:hypothetical protein R1sor_010947 [Riccia sorocarpa]|uniref:Reverse transcriptase domain-containing protein n=1 Tax=Riccia sorocarpa TaxID=122646 RepID=A0ABD3I0W4_9MARC
MSEQEVIFVKLDFQKAYDRVSHLYLWKTLTALGMSQENLRRLVVGAAAQVHVNGYFTGRFAVTRGVRQRCPLAPLLFAIVTQPFMRLLREEEASGRIKGVNYGGDKTYTSAGRSFLYLRVNTSNPVNEGEISKAIIKKIEKRLAHWSNRLLSWPAKAILLRHVLAATPLYQLLSVGIKAKGIAGIEALCRQFLLGWSTNDRFKVTEKHRNDRLTGTETTGWQRPLSTNFSR